MERRGSAVGDKSPSPASDLPDTARLSSTVATAPSDSSGSSSSRTVDTNLQSECENASTTETLPPASGVLRPSASVRAAAWAQRLALSQLDGAAASCSSSSSIAPPQSAPAKFTASASKTVCVLTGQPYDLYTQPAEDSPATERGGAAVGASGVQLLCDDEELQVFEHEPHVSASFPMFDEIRKQGKLCDVTLVVDGPNGVQQRFSAHRIVLAATVPYFRAMFTTDMVEATQNDIYMRELDADTLEQLVNFAYRGRIRISVNNVQNIMMGASFLQLSPIVYACAQYLQSRLQATNVLNVRAFAWSLGCRSLVRAADRFVQKHFVSVSKSEEFLQLRAADLVELLGRDQLHVGKEEQVFEAALRWVRHDCASRGGHLPQLLAQVRLPLLQMEYLADNVAGDELIRVDLKCRNLIDEAKDYHLMPQRRPLLQSFKTKARCCNDVPGIIYAVGGLTSGGDSLSTVEMYDQMVSKWQTIEPMRTLRSRVGVAVMKGVLYAIGGFNGHERLRTVEVFTPGTRRWHEVRPLNNKRSALGAVVLCDRLYVCGGYDGITSLASVECYDASADRWSMLEPMHKQRSAAGIAVLNGTIYAHQHPKHLHSALCPNMVGSWLMGGHDGMSIFDSVECYDVESNAWRPVTPMRSKRCRLGACALNGKIYVCGGYDGQQFLRTVECYDPVTDEWTPLAPMNVKRSRVSLVANCGRLFAIGGYDGMTNLSSMEIYSVGENVWRFGASMAAHEGGVGIGVVPIAPPEVQ